MFTAKSSDLDEPGTGLDEPSTRFKEYRPFAIHLQYCTNALKHIAQRSIVLDD